MSIEAYETYKPEFKLIPKEEVGSPNFAVDDVVKEFRRLGSQAQLDKLILMASGLSEDVITTLEAKAAALSYSQAIWNSCYGDKNDTKKLWQEQAPSGYTLQRILAHNLSFAYRKDETITAKIDKIKTGNGHGDMVQDLMEYGVLGKANPSYLEAINFDLTILDTAIQLSQTLGELLADNENIVEVANEAIFERNQAYTYAKQAYDEIREFGKFVFWEDPEKQKAYTKQL